MNQFTEGFRRKTRLGARLSRRPEWEVVAARMMKGRRRSRRRALRIAVGILMLAAVGYFFATASLSAILIAAGLLLALFGGLVVFGLYVMNNIR